MSRAATNHTTGNRLGALRERVVSAPRTSPPRRGRLPVPRAARSDENTISSAGENIAPAELETYGRAPACSRTSAVVVVGDPQWGQAIVSVGCPRPPCHPTPRNCADTPQEFAVVTHP